MFVQHQGVRQADQGLWKHKLLMSSNKLHLKHSKMSHDFPSGIMAYSLGIHAHRRVASTGIPQSTLFLNLFILLQDTSQAVGHLTYSLSVSQIHRYR